MEPLEDPVRRPSNSADWTIARLVPIVVIIVALVVVAGLVGIRQATPTLLSRSARVSLTRVRCRSRRQRTGGSTTSRSP